MSPLRLIVFIACCWTAYTVWQRAAMLRKRLDPRPDTPKPTYPGNWPTIIAMDLAGLAAALWAFELWLNPREISLGAAFFAVSCAVASTVVLGSMIGHNWREAARRARGEMNHDDADKVKEAVAEIPAVIDSALPPVFRDLAAQPDPYRPAAPRRRPRGGRAGDTAPPAE